MITSKRCGHEQGPEAIAADEAGHGDSNGNATLVSRSGVGRLPAVLRPAREPPRMNDLRIMAMAPNPWDGLWMNRQQVLSRLGKRFPILYSTGARSTWDREFFSRGAGGLFGKFSARDSVVIDEPPFLPFRVPGIAALDSAAIRLIARRWRRQLDRFGDAPLVAYLFHPDYEVFLDALRPDYLVYHAYDLLSRTPSWGASEQRQMQVLRDANLIIATSKVIAEDLQARCNRPVTVVPNGVDFEAFQAPAAAEPADLAALPRPRIAHVGRLNRKIDIELMAELARRHPDWSVILIGPVVDLDERDTRIHAQCRSIPNLHLLGAKPRDELPGYMHAIDVGLLAYRTGVLWTEGIYPLKLHEYLASGLPIVSADIPAVRDFPDVVRIARSVDEWSNAIEAALADTVPERRTLRVETARANSWTRRAETIESLLREIVLKQASAQADLATQTLHARDRT